MGTTDIIANHSKTEVEDKVSSHHSRLEVSLMVWARETERRYGRELQCVHKREFHLTCNLHLSRLIMEPTRSPTVMVACSSSWCLRFTNHQSTRNKASARILMPAQMPTYLPKKKKHNISMLPHCQFCICLK